MKMSIKRTECRSEKRSYKAYADHGREFGLYTLYNGKSPEGFMQRSDAVLLHS